MKWLPLHLCRQLHLSTYMYKIINEKSRSQFRDTFSYLSAYLLIYSYRKYTMKHKMFNETQNFNSHFFMIIIVNI